MELSPWRCIVDGMAEHVREKRVTLHDVAKAAGVTHTTVSLVIQGNPRISEETRERVMAVVKELDYRPNRLARQLAGGRNHTIAIVAAFFSSHFELEFMRGLQMAMGISDFRISQHSTRGRDDFKDQIFDELLHENLAEGVIALNLCPQPEMLAAYRKAGIPVILIEEDMADAIVIKTDNYRGAYMATEHLIQRGYQHIALLSGAMDNEEPGSSPMERYEGYCGALRSAGRKVDTGLVWETEDYEIEDGIRLLERMRGERPEIDAIFCSAGDLVAFGLMRYAKRNGLAIPGDLAIVGYDDHFVAEIVHPALTTMRQPIYTMGSTALIQLIQAIKTPPLAPNLRTIYSPELIVRETT